MDIYGAFWEPTKKMVMVINILSQARFWPAMTTEGKSFDSDNSGGIEFLGNLLVVSYSSSQNVGMGLSKQTPKA